MCRQISALQTQLDSKKRDFSEYVAKELQELQDCGKLDEVSVLVTFCFQSFNCCSKVCQGANNSTSKLNETV